MHIQDIDGGYEVSSISDLEFVLQRRDKDGANAFWLSHETGRYPILSLLVKGELAALHFMQKEREAGCRSVGKLTNGETTRFAISKHCADDVQVINDSLIPLSAAVAAAKEYFSTGELPQSVEWFWL